MLFLAGFPGFSILSYMTSVQGQQKSHLQLEAKVSICHQLIKASAIMSTSLYLYNTILSLVCNMATS